MEVIEKILNFIDENPEFRFDINEFHESTYSMDLVEEDFIKFSQEYGKSISRPWAMFGKRIKKLAKTTPAYSQLNFNYPLENSFKVINKQDYKEDPQKFLNADVHKGSLWIRPTSGTTGRPTEIFYTSKFYFSFLSRTVLKLALTAGMLDDDLKTREVLACALTGNLRIDPMVSAIPSGDYGLFIKPLVDMRNKKSIDYIAKLLNKTKPGLITLYPRILQFLLENSTPELIEGIKKSRLISCGGSLLTKKLKDDAEEIFGIPILDYYGLSEVGVIGAECPKKKGFHLFESDHIIEVKEKNGDIKLTGKGEVIATGLRNSGTVLIRYNTGDLGELVKSDCTCGFQGRSIVNLKGRRILNFSLGDGKMYSPRIFRTITKLGYILEFRITETKKKELLFEVKLDKVSLDEVKEQIEKEIQSKINEINEEISFSIVENNFKNLPKFERYRSLA